jgi:hypothetical protein
VQDLVAGSGVVLAPTGPPPHAGRTQVYRAIPG